MTNEEVEQLKEQIEGKKLPIEVAYRLTVDAYDLSTSGLAELFAPLEDHFPGLDEELNKRMPTLIGTAYSRGVIDTIIKLSKKYPDVAKDYETIGIDVHVTGMPKDQQPEEKTQ